MCIFVEIKNPRAILLKGSPYFPFHCIFILSCSPSRSENYFLVYSESDHIYLFSVSFCLLGPRRRLTLMLWRWRRQKAPSKRRAGTRTRRLPTTCFCFFSRRTATRGSSDPSITRTYCPTRSTPQTRRKGKHKIIKIRNIIRNSNTCKHLCWRCFSGSFFSVTGRKRSLRPSQVPLAPHAETKHRPP